MILLLHILIALSSVGYSTFAVVAPSAQNIRISYALIGGTIISGTWLVISSHAAILSSCASGLTYVSIALSLVTVARRRLSKE